MNLLSDIVTYVRRIIKSPSNSSITDSLIIDYINRFWIMDVDARIQLFDLKKKYQFQTTPGVDKYNMPLYNVQIEPGAQSIGMYPVYQGFLGPCYINGVEVGFYTQKHLFYNIWPNVTQNMGPIATGNGTTGPYTLNFPVLPNQGVPLNPPFSAILRGHVDMAGIISTGLNQDPPVGTNLNLSIPVTSVDSSVFITSIDGEGNNVVVQDSGQFLQNDRNHGLLMTPGKAPFGNQALPNGGGLLTPYATNQNTINYFTGVIENLYFPTAIPAGADINAQCLFFQSGLPRGILYYNNTITMRSPPSSQFLVELDAYMTPAAFFSTSESLAFAYMAEYIARGAARKILSDTGDIEQFNFYEPLFLEQEQLVWKRSQRQWTSTRVQTIYSQGDRSSQLGGNTLGVSIQ